MKDEILIYIHWPFCLSKCHYCDFYSVPCGKSHINSEEMLNFYTSVANQFLRYYKGQKVRSIFFGGGTPSLASSSFINGIIKNIKNNFNVSQDTEITLEANPNTINIDKAEQFKQAGINRLSIGIQSLLDEDLKLLGRSHSAEDGIKCLLNMATVFDNISIDLIHTRPFQELDNWKKELDSVFRFPINHLSCYQLIIEDGTTMKQMVDSGKVSIPSDDEGFFDGTNEIIQKHGFEMYEVSNFALNGTYSKHNTGYWKYLDYYGIGPSAHSRVSINDQKVAMNQIADTEKWKTWAIDPVFKENHLSEDDVFLERLIMGLRTKWGIDPNYFSEDIKEKYNFYEKIDNLLRNLYIIVDREGVRLTYEGIKRINLIIGYLIGGK